MLIKLGVMISDTASEFPDSEGAGSPLLQELNPEQRRAVTSEAQYQLVLAGAGSGKTRVLTHRIAWLILGRGVDPYSILAVTFTNKAAREMQQRVEQEFEGRPPRLMIGTFHATALRLLRIHWEAAGLQQNFTVIDAQDQLRLLRRLCREHERDTETLPQELRDYINRAKDGGHRADKVPQSAVKVGSDPLFRGMYREYEQLCERQGVVDFSELLLRAQELWQNHPDILAHYQNRFQYLLVDEFQDTNALQNQWLMTLGGTRANIMVVGDDDQSIYLWRGARVEHILEFGGNFDSDKVDLIRLEQNYRSTSTLLEAANAVISKNSRRHAKKLWTDGEAGEPISMFTAWNEYDEAAFVADRIRSLVDGGYRYSELVVLYRWNSQSRVLEEALTKARLPYRIRGGLRFYDRREIRDMFAWLRLLVNPADDSAFERAIQAPKRGVGESTLARLRELATARGQSMWEIASEPTSELTLSGRPRRGLEEFCRLQEQLRTRLAEQSDVEAIAKTVLEQSGLATAYESEIGEQAQTRRDNLNELINACAQYSTELGERASLEEFLNQHALEADKGESGEEPEALQLMTIHSAKGLEFPVVFLVGLEEGLWPHHRTLDKPAELEEERRLCYVAITRARKQLYMSWAKKRRVFGRDRVSNRRSRFLEEVPRKLLLNLTPNADGARGSSPPIGRAVETAAVVAEENSVWTLGLRVMHSRFGEGTVVGLEGRGAHARLRVHFCSTGHKWMVASHAGLKPLA